MLLHDPSPTARPLSRSVRLPHCPQCGDSLLAPLLAELVEPRHVRNHWVCESCGHSFRKSHTFALSVDEDLIA
jgi:predicted RNA-binding Zn-ribbon protein involved in translation (DUF1610 family)